MIIPSVAGSLSNPGQPDSATCIMQAIRLHDASFVASAGPMRLSLAVLGRTYPGQNCALAFALELIGERWTMLIVRDARFRGSKRFGEFQKSLGIATNVLAKRLDHLVEAGLMQFDPASGTYHLTESGNDLLTVAIAATEWGERWVGRGPVDFIDAATGNAVTAALIDVESGQRVASSSVVVRRRD